MSTNKSTIAFDLIPYEQNTQPTIPSNYFSPIQNSYFPFRSAEAEIKSILKPTKKDEENKVNRKVLATDDSGGCGDGVTYTFTASIGELVISGTGKMTDYSSSSSPWSSYCSSIKTVTIGSGVTSIGSSAFYDCSGLTSVTIGSGVTSIGSYAFYNCYGLTSVTIPDSVTSIGSSAFYNCYGLTSVTIGSGVTSIGSSAFYYCKGLTSINVDANNAKYKSIDGILYSKDCKTLITYPAGKTGSFTIPNSVTSIGSYAFDSCSGLTSINVDANNAKYKSIDGILYSKDCKTLITYPAGKTGSFTIPNSVTSIGSYAFSYCSGLTSVTIPDSVTSIGGFAFSYCDGLTSVTIPNSVTSIGSSAFHKCYGLTSVTIGSGVTSIGIFAFFNCYRLTSVTYLGKNDPSASSVYVFDSTQVSTVSVPSAYTSSTFCGKTVTKPARTPWPTRSRSPLPTRSRSPLPTRSRSPLPTPSRSPLPTLKPTPLQTPFPTPTPSPKPITVHFKPRRFNNLIRIFV